MIRHDELCLVLNTVVFDHQEGQQNTECAPNDHSDALESTPVSFFQDKESTNPR